MQTRIYREPRSFKQYTTPLKYFDEARDEDPTNELGHKKMLTYFTFFLFFFLGWKERKESEYPT
jgi:hypothetical protein